MLAQNSPSQKSRLNDGAHPTRGGRLTALKDPQLLTQKQDLEIFVALRAAADSEQVKEHRNELSD